MPVPEQEIAAAAAAHGRLRATVEQLTEPELRRPSLLPDWTVAHVLTHLARNADSVVRRLEGAARGELVAQYDGGLEGRAVEIERDAHSAAVVVLDDVVQACEAVDRAFREAPAEVWVRPILLGSGEQRPATHLPASRWREVEVHHVDLGVGYGPGEWSDAFVRRFLPEVLASLEGRADRAGLLAWGLGRAAPPVLAPWS